MNGRRRGASSFKALHRGPLHFHRVEQVRPLSSGRHSGGNLCRRRSAPTRGRRRLADLRHLRLCRENSFTLLCRLLFILYAEDRRLLPYRTNPLYTANRSLARLRDEIAKRLDDAKARRGDDYRRTSTALWDDLLQLFDLIDEGSPRYGVPAYNGGLFAPEGHPFLNDKKLDDWHLARVIDNFGRTNDPKHPDLGVFRVDYRDLALQHLGGVYEGLLELHPTLAKVRTRVFSRRNKGRIEECYVPDGEPLPEGFHPTDEAFGPGSVYLVTDKRERRAFGSYYTPDHIVAHIIRQTVEPLCDRLTSDITNEIAAAKKRKATDEELDALQSDFPNRLLKLRILDPSMGSGHFLLAACQYLAEQIATNPFTPPGPEATDEEDTLAFWKRRVIENCLYGVDLNPLAVDLAKLALWLESVSKDRPLTFLDPHLKEGNSLIGARLSRLAGLNGAGGMLAAMFPATFAGKLPTLLAPLAAIRDAPSDTLKSIKEKESQFGSYQKAVEPFKLLANVWTADAAGFRVDPASYATAAAKVDAPRTFKAFAAEAWFHDAASCAEKLRAFHWDLAFPEVFCDEGGPRAGGGFDAVIGNPPYEVLSELESGIDPTALKKFIESESLYTPAVRGKQNLYKLFICRAIDVLRDGGRFGFIVPMALLGDDIASDLRRGMVAAGEFEGVDAFPQKDVPSKRVFEDAKLSTAVFSFVKQRPEVEPRKFRSRVHSERDIDPTSPFLELTTAEIPLYDPDNFTVVSCSQADWDLAVRIMKMGRMKRLREYVDFFQGEVNETNEKKKGTLVQSDSGKLVIRGASICLYTSRIASQGDDLFLDVEAFLKDKGADTKAFHHRHRRVGWQESSPQNNFRRIIAALIPAGEFFNHTVNYLTEFHAKVPLSFVVGLLNSTLADWYFRLGSTNAHVSHYQLYNLPCPIFREKATTEELAMGKLVAKRLNADEPHRALLELDPLFETAPFSPVVRDAIVAAVEKIIAIETDRGEIARAARSALAPAAQPFQDFIDECFFRLAGLTPAEVTGLKQRYQAMKKVK